MGGTGSGTALKSDFFEHPMRISRSIAGHSHFETQGFIGHGRISEKNTTLFLKLQREQRGSLQIIKSADVIPIGKYAVREVTISIEERNILCRDRGN